MSERLTVDRVNFTLSGPQSMRLHICMCLLFYSVVPNPAIKLGVFGNCASYCARCQKTGKGNDHQKHAGDIYREKPTQEKQWSECIITHADTRVHTHIRWSGQRKWALSCGGDFIFRSVIKLFIPFTLNSLLSLEDIHEHTFLSDLLVLCKTRSSGLGRALVHESVIVL